MPLKKLKIKVESSGAELTVLYNPEEYTVNKDNNFAETQSKNIFGKRRFSFLNASRPR